MCCTVYSLEMYLLKAKKERDESNMLSCSVHTTVTLKVENQCVREGSARVGPSPERTQLRWIKRKRLCATKTRIT